MLSNPEHFGRARDYLARLFFSELERHYTKKEMHNLVLPLLERRHLAYAAILDGSGDPGTRLNELGRAIVRQIVEEHVDDIQMDVAAMFLVGTLLIEPSKKIKAMNEAGKIKW